MVKRIFKSISWIILLILIALTGISVWSHATTKHIVTIQNDSSYTLQDFTVIKGRYSRIPEIHIEFGDIAKGEVISGGTGYTIEGVLLYSFKMNGELYEDILNGYVSSGYNSHVRLVVDKDQLMMVETIR